MYYTQYTLTVFGDTVGDAIKVLEVRADSLARCEARFGIYVNEMKTAEKEGEDCTYKRAVVVATTIELEEGAPPVIRGSSILQHVTFNSPKIKRIDYLKKKAYT